jgi:2-polyprenyl-3-methyl-5-hydroxy-6-metoxy-1,4-benzoquinol methylase
MPLTHSERPQKLTPEILDHLPAEHPDAVQSRKDIRAFNRALGNWRWFAKVLPHLARPGEKTLEIGAGSGDLCARLDRLGLWADGLDLVPRPANFSAARAWHETDLFNFAGWRDYPVVIANLFVHHFDSEQLATLGRHLNEHARVVVVGDLRRGRIQQYFFAALARSLRANYVSRHDGWVSVGAGFRGQELPRLLGLDPERWSWKLPAHFFAYRMIAERRS